MAVRLNVFTIFLLFSIGYVLAANGSGSSKKKKVKPPKLSDNIDNNPFLHNRVKYDAPEDYQNNPFLSNNVNILNHPSGSASEQHNNVSFVVNLPVTTDNQKLSMGFYIHNPFLHEHMNQGNIGNNYGSPGPLINTPYNQTRPEQTSVMYKESFSVMNTYTGERTKSLLKCNEYGRQVVSTQVLSLVGANSEVIDIADEKCKTTNRLIVGGVSATPGEFAHMVALGVKTENGKFSFTCGGTLIAPEWVLTAAHCTHGPKSPKDVRIGLHNLNEQRGITTTINRIIRHPNYKPPAMYSDIALIKLNTTITFNKEIRPACLYQQFDSVPTRAWVSGWGVTEFGSEQQSAELQKAELDIIDNIACAIRHNQSIAVPYGVTPSMVCAGDPRGNWTKDTCQGDSGGPLQIVHPKNPCLFQVLGITSFGIGCAIVDSPGVYTRVSHYLGWVEDIVWP